MLSTSRISRLRLREASVALIEVAEEGVDLEYIEGNSKFKVTHSILESGNLRIPESNSAFVVGDGAKGLIDDFNRWLDNNGAVLHTDEDGYWVDKDGMVINNGYTTKVFSGYAVYVSSPILVLELRGNELMRGRENDIAGPFLMLNHDDQCVAKIWNINVIRIHQGSSLTPRWSVINSDISFIITELRDNPPVCCCRIPGWAVVWMASVPEVARRLLENQQSELLRNLVTLRYLITLSYTFFAVCCARRLYSTRNRAIIGH
jgi:hypothetical protein